MIGVWIPDLLFRLGEAGERIRHNSEETTALDKPGWYRESEVVNH